MDSVLAAETRTAGSGMAVGLFMVVLGFLVNGIGAGPMKFVAFVMVLAGVVQFSSNFGRMLKIRQLNDREHGGQGPFQHTGFSRRTLSRQVMALLVSVAEADGTASREERALVQRFLLERFFDWELVNDLRRWRAPRLPAGGLEELARTLAGLLGPTDREALFHWCCLVTFVDRSFSDVEHDALQRVARGFQLDPAQARRTFLDAKARAMAMFSQQERYSGWGGGARQGGAGGGFGGGQSSGWGGGQGYRSSGGQQRTAPRPRGMTRTQALQILGLPLDATTNDIRRRHRELVKKHHPDRTSHLGEIARRQATERFTEIQKAYEELTKS